MTRLISIVNVHSCSLLSLSSSMADSSPDYDAHFAPFDLALISPIKSMPRSLQQTLGSPRASPAKRRRLDNKENVTPVKKAFIKVETSDKEKDMLEALLAGLDDSVFNNVLTPERPKRDAVCDAVGEDIYATMKKETYATASDLKSPANAACLQDSLPSNLLCDGVQLADVDLDALLQGLDGELDFEDEDELGIKPASGLYPILHPVLPIDQAYQATPWTRCVVDAVASGLQYADGVIPVGSALEAGTSRTPSGEWETQTLVVTMVKTGLRRVLHLKDDYGSIRVSPGDIINVISSQLEAAEPSLPLVFGFAYPTSHLILHPDNLLTMTSIANALPCPRKPLVQALIKTPAPPTKPLLYGNLIHTLLQGALQDHNFSARATSARLEEELKKETTKMEIWWAGLGIEEVREEVGARACAEFETFAERWVGAEPSVIGVLNNSASTLAISGLHDVEEDIWSSKWGLKGKVDASVQAIVRAGDATSESVAPLEIKTGRSVGVMAHRAQTMLYALLMEERYASQIPAGLLYYTQLNQILRVAANKNEIRSLIAQRNDLATYLSRKRALPGSKPATTDAEPIDNLAFLPPTIDHPRECKTCYASDSCMLYRRTIDDVAFREDDPIAELYSDKMSHLTELDAEFFRKWEGLVTVEEQDAGRFRSQLWTMSAKEREKTGRCFSDMVIAGYSNNLGSSMAKIHRHTYKFVRANPPCSSQASKSLLTGHIARGDPVNLSIEPDLLCLSRGFVVDLTPTHVTVGVTYKIDVDALLARTRHQSRDMAGDSVVFRIDKDEMASGMARMRNNIAQLFFAGGDENRRRLIVHLEAPRFETAHAPRENEYPGHLNGDQRNAMAQCLTAKDYALVLGMPGTGKTTTVAEIIKALVARGKSVLLTSYTHSAVDTILMKLVNEDFGILRLGNVDKVHPDVQHFTLEAKDQSTSLSQLEARLLGPQVVAATCLSIDHPLFSRRRFDYCIVDEASQITLPTCLGPLRCADTFVLVGDHFQLPPIVKNPDARRGGLDVSLFRLLADAHPGAVVDLAHQYRMNEDIMLLSNKLIYDDKLACGSEQVARQALVLPNGAADWLHAPETGSDCHSDCWLQDLLNEDAKAIFVDTDLLPAVESRVGDLVQNDVEGRLVYQLATTLVRCGIREHDIGVISPYRQQIKLLNNLLNPTLPDIEILTADKSQGRDKDCILISLVRSNNAGNVGDLLRDWRRINVSFTRAKKKLVIFGSKTTLQADRLLSEFLSLMLSKGWIRALQPGADKIHAGAFPEPTELLGKVERKESKKGQVGDRVLKARPFMREALADIIDSQQLASVQ